MKLSILVSILKRKRLNAIVFVLLLVLFLGHCPEVPLASSEEEVLARVDDWKITLLEFKNRVDDARALIPPSEGKNNLGNYYQFYLGPLIDIQLYAQEARRLGMDKKDDFIKRLQDYNNAESKYSYLLSSQDNVVKILAWYMAHEGLAGVARQIKPEDFLFTTVLALVDYKSCLLASSLIAALEKNVEVPDQDIKEVYDISYGGYRQIKAKEIVFSSLDQAKEAQVRLLKNEDFSALVQQYSIGETKNTGGDIKLTYDPRIFFNNYTPTKFPKYWRLVFSLKKGEMTDVFTDLYSNKAEYYIVKIENITEGTELFPFETKKEEIKNIILKSKVKAELAEITLRLMNQIKFENNRQKYHLDEIKN